MSRAAAGVACGLAVRSKPGTDEIEKYQILTDISVSSAVTAGCMVQSANCLINTFIGHGHLYQS